MNISYQLYNILFISPFLLIGMSILIPPKPRKELCAENSHVDGDGRSEPYGGENIQRATAAKGAAYGGNAGRDQLNGSRIQNHQAA